MRIPINSLILFVACTVAGCDLEFGDNVELSGAAFDAAKLAEVSNLTGVSFPQGARGIEYFYLGSGIDDALAAKVMIPEKVCEKRGMSRCKVYGKDALSIGSHG